MIVFPGAFVRAAQAAPWDNESSARYEIAVANPNAVCRGVVQAELDGKTLPAGPTRVPLVDDGQTHTVRVVLR